MWDHRPGSWASTRTERDARYWLEEVRPGLPARRPRVARLMASASVVGVVLLYALYVVVI